MLENSFLSISLRILLKPWGLSFQPDCFKPLVLCPPPVKEVANVSYVYVVSSAYRNTTRRPWL